MQTLLCVSLSAPAMAETVQCDLSGIPVSFEIDLSQFAPAHSNGEPPRRKVTEVAMGDTRFAAEPIVLGAARGFLAIGAEENEIMLMMQPNGSAVFVDPQAGQRLTGQCEVLQ